MVSFTISNLYVTFKNNKYNKIYELLDNKEITVSAVVVSNVKKSKYNDSYTIKVNKISNKKFDNINLKLNVKNPNGKILQYGELINIKGKFKVPNVKRNYKGFDYREYLKTKNIYGILECKPNQIQVLDKNKINPVFLISNIMKNKIIKKQNANLPEESGALINGILLGYTDDMSKDLNESFKASSLSHILSVSRDACCLYNTDIKKYI